MLKFTLLAFLQMALASEDEGPYNVILRQISGCEDTSRSFIRPKINPESQSKFPHVSSLTLTQPIRSEDKANLVMAAWIDGEWKANYFQKDFEQPCQLVKKLFSAYFINNIKTEATSCEIPIGSYNVEEFLEGLYKALPTFTYHQFKVDIKVQKNDTETGCIRLYMDMTQRALTA